MKPTSRLKNELFLFLFFINLLTIQAQSLTDYIVIDQFGYRPNSDKTAILRDPQTGYDSGESFNPGTSYALVNAANSQQVFTGTPTIWNGGNEDASSGDATWSFNFSSYNTPGRYYILDITNNVRSFEFEIRDDIYNQTGHKNILLSTSGIC